MKQQPATGGRGPRDVASGKIAVPIELLFQGEGDVVVHPGRLDLATVTRTSGSVKPERFARCRNMLDLRDIEKVLVG